MFKKVLIWFLGLGFLGILAFGLLAWRRDLSDQDPAAESFPAELVAKGEVLAGAGYCASCHTAKGGQPFRRRLPMADALRDALFDQHHARTGDGNRHMVGGGFRRAMHEGVARDGSHLFPAFPTIISPSCRTTTSRRSMPIS